MGTKVSKISRKEEKQREFEQKVAKKAKGWSLSGSWLVTCDVLLRVKRHRFGFAA
jgi:hypothetical protein